MDSVVERIRKHELYDAHCHISTGFNLRDVDELAEKVGQWPCTLVVMSTNHLDYRCVEALAQRCDNVIPSFGVHPWYAHLFSFDTTRDKKAHYTEVFGSDVDDCMLQVLPDPMDFDEHMDKLVECCERYEVVVWGECGLDKLFRVPTNGFFGNPVRVGDSTTTKLSSYRVSMAHQKRVLQRQLDVAMSHNLPLSLHNVKSGGVLHTMLHEALHRCPLSTSRVCLHSYTGSVDTLRLLHSVFGERVYVSLSQALNMADANAKDKTSALAAVLAPAQLLAETDLCVDTAENIVAPLAAASEHCARLRGPQLCPCAPLISFLFGRTSTSFVL